MRHTIRMRAPAFALVLAFVLPTLASAQPAITSRGSVSAMVDALPRVDATEMRVRVEDTIDVALDEAWSITIGSWADALVGTRRGEGVRALAFQPGEIHARYRHARFDVTAGFQRVAWGTLDEIQPTDVVNPLDVSRFLIEGRGEARLPVLAFRGRVFLPQDTTLDAVYVPFFRRGRYDVLDEDTSPFNLLAERCRDGVCVVPLPGGTSSIVPRVSSAPARTLGNGSVGARVSRPLAGVDLGASVYRGWQAFPLASLVPTVPLRPQATGDPGAAVTMGALRESWSRITMLGADAEAARGSITWRAEGAWLVDTAVQAEPGGPATDGRSVQVGGGLDWTTGPWRTFANVIVRRAWAVGPAAALVSPSGGMQVVGGAERTFARDTWRVRGFAVGDPSEGTAFIRALAAWNLRDNLWLEGTTGWFSGDGTDFLGQFTDRDFVTLRVRYHF
jgi:hypothetical protein